MKILILLLLATISSSVYSHECTKWEYGILYLSYNHDGDAHQQWETSGKIYNWIEGEVRKLQKHETNDTDRPMKDFFDFQRKIRSRPDNLDAIGNLGWELVSETITPNNMATYYFKRCKM